MKKKIIPYGRQFIDKKDIREVSRALNRDLITSGSLIEKFEKNINKYLGCRYSSACNSGTSALYLALLSINLKKNDVVIMPAINFIASYNIVKNLDAKIYLSDVDKKTGQMRPQDVEECINRFNIKKIKSLILMYNGGMPNNVENFQKLKKKYKFILIEDACHALGSNYIFKKKIYKVGSCKHSDISTFSLHPLKTITTGEGGIVTTNSKYFNDKIKKLRSLGIVRNKSAHWKYDVIYKGYNFRLNEFQSALGISQLTKINKFINYRKKIAALYSKSLSSIKSITLPDINPKYNSSNHLYLINLKKPNLKIKEKFIKYMLKNNILVQYHYTPIYKFSVFNDKFLGKNSEYYFKSTVSLPIYYNLNRKEQLYVIKKIKYFFRKNLQ